ncbi:MAG: hypothetical protein SNJ52_00115 [Verrucomicrobiia bacterium]
MLSALQVLAILVILALIAVADFFIPINVQVSWVYLLPIAVSAPRASVVQCLFISIMATLFWTVSNILATGGPIFDFVRVWNAGSRFLLFYSFASLIHYFVAQLGEKESALRLLRAQREQASPAMGLRRLCHNCGMVHTTKGDWLPLTAWLSRDCMVAWADSQCPQCAKEHGEKNDNR